MYNNWEELEKVVKQCRKCKLCETRKNVVFGVGNRGTDIMFIGEGPGADEDAQGEPFVGKAGKLMNMAFDMLGIKREEVYIANIVKCRPPNNRNPQDDEAENCLDYLRNQVILVKPKIIVLLGSVALKNILGKEYDIPDSDPVYILSNEEVEKILERFSNNPCVYYAFLTAYYTGLRVSEVFGLTWDDIDFVKRTITVNKNILKKNQAGGTKKRLISGNSTTVWYFGTCKTKGSYRTIEIGDTLLKALKKYKEEQIQNRKDYGDTYMKHYKKIVNNPYNNKPEIKIINAYAELEVPLEEVKLVFLKKNGVFEGTDSCKYPFKVIHYELGIPCRFHDFRDTHATRLIEAGADIKAVSKRLGHSNIRTTYEIYVKVTTKMESDTVEKFESIGLNLA